ncbi:transporter [Naumannella sp. ID2617S]|nr:transporter [Naumannella sp. ID2617S]
MGAVGLIYVGAVLFVNGVMLLGHVSPRGAAPLNFFVGMLQVVTPTVLIVQSGGDPDKIFAASGLYLFGFTYLWVAINNWWGDLGQGLGWFSLFVAACACFYSWHAFVIQSDPAFGVIWLMWALLWFMFFVLLGLGVGSWAAPTGIVAAVEGVATAAIPGLLMAAGKWPSGWGTALVLIVVAVVMIGAAWPLGARLTARTAVADPVTHPTPGAA